MHMSSWMLRGVCAAMLVSFPFAVPVAARAEGLGGSVTGLLGNASDHALDKLAQPNAFYADEAIRILLPGPLKRLTKIMKYTDKAGLTSGLSHKLNDAAGLAAKEAKPIFRSAIEKMTLKDGVGIVSKDNGATAYLRESAGADLREKMRPLIVAALGEVGAYRQLDKLGSSASLLSGVGVSRDGLTDSVTDQALNGIFKYIGNEEAKLRANPLDVGKALLKGLNQ